MMLVKNDAKSRDSHEFLLPGRSLQLLASISTDKDVFEVGDMGKEIVFTKENMMFSMHKIEGDFIDVNMVVKSIKPEYTAKALKNIAKVSISTTKQKLLKKRQNQPNLKTKRISTAALKIAKKKSAKESTMR